MPKVLLKSYAIKHKMSLFEVVKQVKNGELICETVTEEGKEVRYIIEKEVQNGPQEKVSQGDRVTPCVEEQIANLNRRITQLEQEVAVLRKQALS